MTKIQEDVYQDVEVQAKDSEGILLWDGEDSNGDPIPLMTTEKQLISFVYDSGNMPADPDEAAAHQAKIDDYETKTAEIETLNAITEQERFRLYDYIEAGVNFDPVAVPKGVDYVVQVNKRFPRKNTFNEQGELSEVIYYEDINNDGTLDEPVIKVDVVYNRDGLGNVTDRTTTRSWFKKNGTETQGDDTKVTKKIYSGGDVVREGVRRRENIVRNLEIQVLSIILTTQAPADNAAAKIVQDSGLAFMAEYDGDFNKFIKAQSLDINTSITNANTTTYAWLTDTITQGIIDAGLADVAYLNDSVADLMKDKLGKINNP